MGRQAVILSIGTELLEGKILNTNASYMAKKLSQNGIGTRNIITLADDEKSIIEAISDGFKKCSLIIATGGLGPTLDDITKEAAAKYFGLKKRVCPQLKKTLEMRYGTFPSLENQAEVIEGAEVLTNPFGTAPGLYLKSVSKQLFLLPGVSEEMKNLLKNEVLPRLKGDFKNAVSIHLTELLESDVDPILQDLKAEFPEIVFGIYPKNGIIEITMKSSNPFIEAERRIRKAFEGFIFQSPSGLIEEAVHILLKERGLKLAVCESCTGGIVSAKLTQISGASSFFLGSLVAYDNRIKEKGAFIDKNILESYGAVSLETALFMAKGALKFFESDIAISVTGIAGPSGGVPKKPVGTAILGLAFKNGMEKTKKIHVFGNRQMVMEGAANHLLGFLYHNLKRLDR